MKTINPRAFKACFMHQQKTLCLCPIITTALFLWSYLISIIISIAEYGSIDFSRGEICGLDSIIYCVSCSIGIIYFQSYINTAAANGCSRNTCMLAFFASTGAASAVTGILYAILTALSFLITKNHWTSYAELMYGEIPERLAMGENGPSVIITYIFLIIALSFAMTHAGAFISAVFYRLNKAALIILTAVIILGTIALTVIPQTSIMIVNAVEAFIKFCGIDPSGNLLDGDPLRGVLVFLLIAVIQALLTWLIMRRASIKTSSITAS